MKRSYVVVAAIALEWAAGLNVQQSVGQTSVSSVVSCVSRGRERQQCPADTRAGIVMLRSTGEAACLLGRNWGYDDQGVWVSEGCGGDFGTGSSSRASAPSAGAALAQTIMAQSPVEASQMENVTTGTNPGKVYTGGFQPYGSMRTIISIPANGSAEVQDDATRVGINFATFGAIKVIGTTEWGVNLVQSETSLNAGATTASGFGEVQQVTQPVFGARLGFFGVDTGKFGRLSYGKQLSTHYDITSYTTDRFNVFGGISTATYVAGTDGGQSGTGRADQTILYHVNFAKIFDFGAQGQLRTGDTSQAFNGFGFSLQAKVLPSLKIGGAYNKTYFDQFLTNTVLHGGTDYWAFGGMGKWRNVEWGGVYIHQNRGDLTFIPDPAGGPDNIAVGFSANGVELYSRLWFGKFAAVLGFEDYIPFDLSPLINPNFKTRYAVLGAEWHISPSGYAFIESRLGDTTDAEGNGGNNAAALGFRYDFTWKTLHLQ
jgi:predicted porin